jgi:hypothetical protein
MSVSLALIRATCSTTRGEPPTSPTRHGSLALISAMLSTPPNGLRLYQTAAPGQRHAHGCTRLGRNSTRHEQTPLGSHDTHQTQTDMTHHARHDSQTHSHQELSHGELISNNFMYRAIIKSSYGEFISNKKNHM